MIEIVAHGIPAPKGSKAIVKRGDKAWMIDSSTKRHRSWEPSVVAACRGVAPIPGPVSVEAEFRFPRPKSHLLKSGELAKGKPRMHVSRPDLSKLMRELEDIVVQCGVIEDDSKIVTYRRVSKRYCPPGDEGCTLRILKETSP